MTKRRMLGVLLIVIAVLVPLFLWWLGVKLVEIAEGAEVIIYEDRTASSQVTLSD